MWDILLICMSEIGFSDKCENASLPA